jgi:hypothetical protein
MRRRIVLRPPANFPLSRKCGPVGLLKGLAGLVAGLDPGRVLTNARMSGIARKAEMFHSVRALPVLT